MGSYWLKLICIKLYIWLGVWRFFWKIFFLLWFQPFLQIWSHKLIHQTLISCIINLRFQKTWFQRRIFSNFYFLILAHFIIPCPKRLEQLSLIILEYSKRFVFKLWTNIKKLSWCSHFWDKFFFFFIRFYVWRLFYKLNKFSITFLLMRSGLTY